MSVVIDSNIIFSALIRDSYTRKLIMEYDDKFLFPDYIFDEIIKHKYILLSKSGLSHFEFDDLLKLILRNVHIVNRKNYEKYKEKAIKLTEPIDINDAIFVACSLAYKSILWSDDKKLKLIPEITVLNTFEFSKLINFKS